MSRNEKDVYITNIFTRIAPHIDFLSTAFSFGLSSLWRRTLVSSPGIKQGDKVLDLCTGTGELASLLIKKVGPQGSVIGIDVCKEMLDIANKKMNHNCNNLSFILSDAKKLVFSDNTFDAATAAFGMRNIPDTIPALKEIWRVLKPGGRFLILELTWPHKKWFLPIYKLYVFKFMPLVSKIIAKTATPYIYLSNSIDSFYQPEQFKDALEKCGFSNATIHSMTMGAATLYSATKGD